MDEIRCECPICLQPFEVPRGLPCLHNFCTKCLQWHIDENREGECFECPMCRSLTVPPNTSLDSSTWATGFPVANVVCELMEVLRVQDEKNKSPADDCEICLHKTNVNTDAIAFCKTCKLNMCEDCSDTHSIGFPGHTLMLDRDSFVVNPRQECDNDDYPVCPTHKNTTLDLFCIRCDKFICLKCTFGKHALCAQKYGNIKSIDVLSEEKLTTDHIQRTHMENRRDTMDQLIKDIEKAKGDLLVSNEKHVFQIDETIDSVIASLESKRAKGKASLEKIFDTRLKTLTKTSSDVQGRLNALNQGILRLQTNSEIENKYEYICASKKTVVNDYEAVDLLLPVNFSVKSDLAFSVDPEFRLISDNMKQVDIGTAFIVNGAVYENAPWCEFETPEKLAVKVYSADIITTKVEGIVNQTDSRLTHSGELSQHITQAAGPAISAANEKVFKSHGQVDQLTLSDVYITPAGNLDFRFIIHAVLPDSEQVVIQRKKDERSLENLISQTVSNSLFVANSLKLKSVALPSFCFCPAFANSYARAYLQGVLDFSKNCCANSTNTLREVHFVDSNLRVTHHIQVVFRKYLKSIYMSTYF